MRTRDQYPLTARLPQTQPAAEEKIPETVSNRTEAFFFAYQASRVQGLKRFVHGGGGEAGARKHLGRTQIFAAFVNDGLERYLLLAVEAVPNLGVRGILASNETDQRIVDTSCGERATAGGTQLFPTDIGELLNIEGDVLRHVHQVFECSGLDSKGRPRK